MPPAVEEPAIFERFQSGEETPARGRETSPSSTEKSPVATSDGRGHGPHRSVGGSPGASRSTRGHGDISILDAYCDAPGESGRGARIDRAAGRPGRCRKPTSRALPAATLTSLPPDLECEGPFFAGIKWTRWVFPEFLR